MSLTRGRELPIGARAGLLDPKHVKAMGSARWLYDWILWRVTSEQDGVGRVLGGSPVRCEEIAADLGVGLRTIYRWMDRLRGPYIRTRHIVAHGRHGLAIEVLKSKKFQPVRPPTISHISTVSTQNPARCGSRNPARFGRDNPARNGGFHKEYRKPFTKSYGKVNNACLDALTWRANSPKTNPPYPPDPEEEKNEKQIPHFVRNDDGGARFSRFAGNDGGEGLIPRGVCAEQRRVVRNDGSARQVSCEVSTEQRRGACSDDAAERVSSGFAEAAPSGQRLNNTPNFAGEKVAEGGQAREAERELLCELRQMMGVKSLPGEPGARRRELLERQKCALLRRAERRCEPP